MEVNLFKIQIQITRQWEQSTNRKLILDNGDEKPTLYEENVRSESRENGGRSHCESMQSERGNNHRECTI